MEGKTRRPRICVFVRGYASESESYSGVWAILARQGFLTKDITDDIEGYDIHSSNFGSSTTEAVVNSAVRAYKAAIERICCEFAVVREECEIVLIGHSMGGNICRRMLVHPDIHPCRIILLNPFVNVLWRPYVLRLLLTPFPQLLNFRMPMTVAYKDQLYAGSPAFAPRTYQRLAADMIDELRAGFPKITRPFTISIIQSARDSVVNNSWVPSFLASAIASPTMLTMLDSACHEPFRLDIFKNALIAHLDHPLA